MTIKIIPVGDSKMILPTDLIGDDECPQPLEATIHMTQPIIHSNMPQSELLASLQDGADAARDWEQQEIRRRDDAVKLLVEAAMLGLARIESDIESPTHKTIEGGLLRSALAAFKP